MYVHLSQYWPLKRVNEFCKPVPLSDNLCASCVCHAVNYSFNY